MNLSQLDKFHRSRSGYAVFGLVELGLAYGAASLSINNGSLLWYFVTIVLAVGALRNAACFLGTFFTTHAHAGAKRG